VSAEVTFIALTLLIWQPQKPVAVICEVYVLGYLVEAEADQT